VRSQGLVEEARELEERSYAIGYKSWQLRCLGQAARPRSQDLVDRLLKANCLDQGTRCYGGSPTGVDAIDLIAKAVEQTGSTDSEGIIKYWNSLIEIPPAFFRQFCFLADPA